MNKRPAVFVVNNNSTSCSSSEKELIGKTQEVKEELLVTQEGEEEPLDNYKNGRSGQFFKQGTVCFNDTARRTCIAHSP